MKKKRLTRIALTVTTLIVIATGVAALSGLNPFSTRPPDPLVMSYAELTGSIFLPAPKDSFRAPRVRELSLPTFDNATSVWGALGRDPRGHIWVGVSSENVGMSAHLFEYDPSNDIWQDHGSVTARLKALGLLHENQGQIKIHSRIVTGGDGWLYFASTDEEGEDPNGGALPRSGSHLWRIHPVHHYWEHLLAMPEGVVAVSGVGRYVYALGYWGHVLYQYDTVGGEVKRTVVGSADGHVSRNFLSDIRGHVYVPRIAKRADGTTSAHLVEFDETLREVSSTAMEFYLGRGSPGENHGIVGLAYLPDGRMAFTTHIGHLYLIAPDATGKAELIAVGRLHPKGDAYAPSLFQLAESTTLAGVVQREGRFDWVVYDLRTQVGGAFPLATANLQKLLLYGSVSRDNAGRAYIGGWAAKSTGGQRPVVLQIDLLDGDRASDGVTH